MNTAIQAVVTAAQQLSPREQLEVIQALSQALQQFYVPPSSPRTATLPAVSSIPATVQRTAPVTDLRQFAADFWPDDESADDFNRFIAHQRATERSADLDEPTERA